MKRVKGKKITMRGLADKQIVGALQELERRTVDLNARVVVQAQMIAWCLTTLKHPQFTTDGSEGPLPSGLVLTDAQGMIHP